MENVRQFLKELFGDNAEVNYDAIVGAIEILKSIIEVEPKDEYYDMLDRLQEMEIELLN